MNVVVEYSLSVSKVVSIIMVYHVDFYHDSLRCLRESTSMSSSEDTNVSEYDHLRKR